MHQPTLRVLEILELLRSDAPRLRLTDFSRKLQIPKSTLLPILQTLCQKQYLHQGEDGLYSAGTALFCLGAAYAGCFPILDYVNQQLELLVSQLGETCYFGALDGGQVLYLSKKDSPQSLRVLTDTGRHLPAYATSLGKALLMDHSRQALELLYPDGPVPLTAKTVTDLDVLFRQLTAARQDGYTWECEESTDHVRCFAVPVRKHGRIAAAVSVALPLFRYDPLKQNDIIAALHRQAGQIGAMMEQTDAHFGELF